jgi:hypothetical protein
LTVRRSLAYNRRSNAIIGDANVLYARYQLVHTDAVSKLPFEIERVLRFTFNNEGKITST